MITPGLKSVLIATAIATGWWDYAHCHVALTGWTYPPSCCSDKDCRMIDSDAVDWTPAGWFIKATGETIPEHQAQISPDDRFHWCASPGGLGFVKTRCLFVPGAGT